MAQPADRRPGPDAGSAAGAGLPAGGDRLRRLSLVLCARALRRALGAEWPHLGHVVLLLLVFVELPLARADFGEREHLLVLLAAPYILAVIGRARGAGLPAMEMAVVGLMAGVGVALKPYFLALPAALECYLAIRRRSVRAWLRPEPIVMLALGAGYLAAVLTVVPQYLDLTAMMGGLYASYLRGPLWLTGILGEGAALCLFALLAFAVLRRRAQHGELWDVLAIAVAALFVAALVQGKGWRYHFYPSMAFGVVLLGVAWWDSRRPLSRLAEQVYSAACGAAVATLLVVMFGRYMPMSSPTWVGIAQWAATRREPVTAIASAYGATAGAGSAGASPGRPAAIPSPTPARTAPASTQPGR